MQFLSCFYITFGILPLRFPYADIENVWESVEKKTKGRGGKRKGAGRPKLKLRRFEINILPLRFSHADIAVVGTFNVLFLHASCMF